MSEERLIEGINKLLMAIERPVRIMEVCGTHTVAIFRHGIRGLFPGLQFLSGPGCPVCVTSMPDVDRAILMSRLPGVTLATFGDMMRVPGSLGTLYEAKAAGADVRVVYSVLDALELAINGNKSVVFFATGFETTAPLAAAALHEARRRNIGNFFVYSVHKLVPPALRALLLTPELQVDGFLLPGHVSTIIGTSPYEFIASECKKPAVVGGFDAKDILEAAIMILSQLATGRADVEVQYRMAVREAGNPKAVSLLEEYFEPIDAYWRGIGLINGSGLGIKGDFSAFDALEAFPVAAPESSEPAGCSCGEVLKGLKIPAQCRLFGVRCTPENPVGACMVSTEGSCAAYYKYGGGSGNG